MWDQYLHVAEVKYLEGEGIVKNDPIGGEDLLKFANGLIPRLGMVTAWGTFCDWMAWFAQPFNTCPRD